MSDQPTEYDDLLRDPAVEDTRISSEEADDLPVAPPDMQPRGGEYLGGDAAGSEETIDQRIMQEEPDPDSAYGAPDDESGLDAEREQARLGGDDPDAIPAEVDVLGGDADSGPMDADYDADSVDEELEIPSHADDLASPEESAMHVEK